MKNGTLITFDFEIKSLQKYYSYSSPKNAYREIGDYLIEKGFEKTKDSDYISYKLDIEYTDEIIRNFAKNNKWFTLSLTKLSITPVQDIWDLSFVYKLLYDDLEFKKQKEKEYGEYLLDEKKVEEITKKFVQDKEIKINNIPDNDDLIR